MDGSKDSEREKPSRDKCHICNKVFKLGEGRYLDRNGAVCPKCYEQDTEYSIEHEDS